MARHALLNYGQGPNQQNPFDLNFDPPDAGVFSFRFRRNPDGSIGTFNGSLPDDGASSFYHVKAVEYILPAGPIQPGGGGLPPDIALVRLEHPVAHIQPIRARFVSEPEFVPDTPLFLAGWGKELDTEGSCERTSLANTRKLKVVEMTGGTDATDYQVVWTPYCQTTTCCPVGSASNDSGGAVLVQLPCGNVELIAVIKSEGDGVSLAQFENDLNFVIPEYVDPCPSDLNDDGAVDGADLGMLLLDWGTPGCGGGMPCSADLDCNGAVDGADLGLLLLTWGLCPADCGSGEAGGSGAPMQSEDSAATPESDPFYEWVLHATLEELFEWLEDWVLEGGSEE